MAKDKKEQLQFDSWKIFRIMSEFVDGFESLANLENSISVFGSARIHEGPYYDLAQQTTFELARRGFSIITGGGPGIMEAANKGAQQAKGVSAGLCVDLPFEDKSNDYVDPKHNLSFRYFFVRKVMFVRYAKAFVALPGGLGTLDELFEALTLVQTQKAHPFPIYLMGASYWEGLIDWLKETAIKQKTLSVDDLNHLTITDDPIFVADDLEKHLNESAQIPPNNF